MKISRTKLYRTQLIQILKYIAKDNTNASKDFENKLNLQIENLMHFPYKCRQSHYIDDKDVRDMVFKKYTIIYKIYTDKISIIDIFNKNKPTYHNMYYKI